ncbi:MAG: hypothetical protein WC284_04450 [Candidimonas sp.]
MPIENEVKFIVDDKLGELWTNLILNDFKKSHIVQHYLNKDTRIRKITKSSTTYIFSFKKPTPDGTIEVECPISEDDYNSLIKTATNSLEKIRFKKKYDNITWDVDYLRNLNSTYFVMAEAEMPVNQKSPEHIPPFIEKHIIYTVPDNDKRFSNKCLSDPEWAEKMLNEISKKN